jgi:hypothetical protein
MAVPKNNAQAIKHKANAMINRYRVHPHNNPNKYRMKIKIKRRIKDTTMNYDTKNVIFFIKNQSYDTSQIPIILFFKCNKRQIHIFYVFLENNYFWLIWIIRSNS